MFSNLSIPGLKKADYGVPFITDIEQLYFRGKETQVACNRQFKSTKIEPINIEHFLTDARLRGEYLPEDNLLSQPKPSTLQPEGFHGNVAINQYGFDHSLQMQVDNDHLLTIAKADSFLKNDTVIDLKKTPDITRDLKNSLRNPVKIMRDVRAPSNATLKKTLPSTMLRNKSKMVFTPIENFKEVAPKITLNKNHLKEKLDFAVQNMDMSIMKKSGRRSMSKKSIRDRILRTVETIIFQSQDPKFSLDLEKHLRENLDIMTGVIAYAQKDPDFQKIMDRVTRDHTYLNVQAPIAPKYGNKGELDPGVASHCFLDDKFVTKDKIAPLVAHAVEPKPFEASIPFSNCNRNIGF